jgi:hypothetical protein
MEDGTMASSSEDLRSVSDALLRDLEALVAAEQEKRTITPDDPRLVDLAAEVDAIAHRVLGLTQAQQDIAGEVHEQAVEGGPDAPTEPIEETPRSMGAILDDWRRAERIAATEPPGSQAAREARAAADGFRDEYRRAYEARRP